MIIPYAPALADPSLRPTLVQGTFMMMMMISLLYSLLCMVLVYLLVIHMNSRLYMCINNNITIHLCIYNIIGSIQSYG